MTFTLNITLLDLVAALGILVSQTYMHMVNVVIFAGENFTPKKPRTIHDQGKEGDKGAGGEAYHLSTPP